VSSKGTDTAAAAAAATADDASHSTTTYSAAPSPTDRHPRTAAAAAAAVTDATEPHGTHHRVRKAVICFALFLLPLLVLSTQRRPTRVRRPSVYAARASVPCLVVRVRVRVRTVPVAFLPRLFWFFFFCFFHPPSPPFSRYVQYYFNAIPTTRDGCVCRDIFICFPGRQCRRGFPTAVRRNTRKYSKFHTRRCVYVVSHCSVAGVVSLAWSCDLTVF